MLTLETEKKLPTLPGDILKQIFSKMPDIYKMPIAKKFYPSKKELQKMVIKKLKKLKNFNYISEKFPEPILYTLIQTNLIQFIIDLSNHLKINIIFKIFNFISEDDIGHIINNENLHIHDLTQNNITEYNPDSLIDIDYLVDIIDNLINEYPSSFGYVINKLVDFGCITTEQEVYELIMDEDRQNLIKILNDLN